jgi:hypothetical protein
MLWIFHVGHDVPSWMLACVFGFFNLYRSFFWGLGLLLHPLLPVLPLGLGLKSRDEEVRWNHLGWVLEIFNMVTRTWLVEPLAFDI